MVYSLYPLYDVDKDPGVKKKINEVNEYRSELELRMLVFDTYFSSFIYESKFDGRKK